jgi:polysaccharide biosynthesis transport protein
MQQSPLSVADDPRGRRWNPLADRLANRSDDDDDTIDLMELWRSITKRKWAILSFALLVGIVTAAVVLTLTPIYRATTVVMFETSKARVVSIEDVYAGVGQNREYLQTQLEILRSREVATRVVQALQLWDHPEYDPRLDRRSPVHLWADKAREALGMAEPQEPDTEWTTEQLTSAVVGPFRDAVQVELLRNSQIANVSVLSSDPALAARAANELARQYIENDLNARFEMTRQATNWLQERLSDLKTKLTQSERELQAFRDRTGIVSRSGEAQAGASGQLEGLTSRLIEARVRRADAEAAYNQVRNVPAGTDLSEVPAVLRAASVSEAKRLVVDAERKFNEVAQRFGPEHPRHVAAKTDVDTARSNLKRQLDTVVASLKREFDAAVMVEREIERTLNQSRSSVQTLNRAEFQLGVLQREVEANREMYNMFMTRAKETTSTSDLQNPIARVVDPALVPLYPVKPRKTQIVAIALLLGLMVAVGASLLIDQLDKTLKTTDDPERKLGVPLLTTLPLLSRREARRAASARLFADQPNSVFAEAVRTARTGVLLSALDEPHRVLLVTSSLPGEGKSTLSVNLALAHAQTQKTLLIDADMRRPSIAKALELPPTVKGLSALVAGNAPLQECVHVLEGTQLTVMPSGILPPNPLELISSNRFRERLAELSAQFDIIVIDSPPVELVSDALMLSQMATGVVFVSKAMATPTPVIAKCLERLQRADGRLLGLVMNQFDFKRASRYYGDYSGYGKYGYGRKGYGSAYGEAYGQKPQQTA